MDLNNGINLVFEKLQRWWVAIIKMLPNFILAMIVLALFFVVAKFIRKWVCKIVQRISKSESVGSLVFYYCLCAYCYSRIHDCIKHYESGEDREAFFSWCWYYWTCIGVCLPGFDIQFYFRCVHDVQGPFELGDKIDTNGFVGTVDHIQLRSTTILTTAGLHVIIPNKDVFQKPIINYSRSESRRVELEFLSG